MWTEERTAIAKRMWLEGHSASAIGQVLLISRNAVIGKLHRLGYAGTRRSPDKRVAKPKAKKVRAITFVPLDVLAPKPIKPPRVQLEPLGPAIEHARADQCRYIAGEPSTPICGRPVARGAFCQCHAELCYVPLAEHKSKDVSHRGRWRAAA